MCSETLACIKVKLIRKTLCHTTIHDHFKNFNESFNILIALSNVLFASTIIHSYPYESIEEIANHLLERTKFRPKIGIICGTGLGHLAENLVNANSFSYEDIPNFPVSTVHGHAGKMIFGLLNGIEVMCMQGRFHYYEGYALAKCSMPVRVMKLVGCTHLIATNAAGGLNNSYNVGDIMIVKDHINIMGFAGNSPLQGPNDLR
jgi:purine-nucleoside phosphorylase